MLDHHDGVAEIAQPPQGFEQAIVIARVQADRRFVEHVQHARQRAADLAGQANALRLAARERRQRSGQREVIEADVDQKRQPARRLVEQVAGDLALRGRELHGLQQRPAIRPAAASRADRSSGRETARCAASARSRLPPHHEQGTSPTNSCSRLPISVRNARGLFDRGEEPLVLELPLPFFAVGDPAIARAVQHEPLLARLEPLEGHIERDLDLPGPRLEHAGEELVRRGIRPRGDRPFRKRAFGIGDQGGEIRSLFGSQALARRAPTERTVERETVRRELLEAAAALMAGEMQAVAIDDPFLFGSESSTRATKIAPRPRSRAVSTEPAIRERALGSTAIRSTTISTACFRRRSICGTSSSRYILPSIRTRRNPCSCTRCHSVS